MENLKQKYFGILLKVLKENPTKYILKDYRGTTIHCTRCYVCGHKNAMQEFIMEWGEPFPIGSKCLKEIKKAIKEEK